MRVFFARPSKGGQHFVVDSRGRARLSEAGIVGTKAAGLAAACALLAVAPETGPGARLIAAGQSVAKSAADYIRARSPGLRAHADLVKIKHPRAAPHRIVHAAPRPRRPAPALPILAPPPAPVPLLFESAELAPGFVPVIAGPVPVFGERPAVPCCFEGINPPITTAVGGIFLPGGGGPPPPPPSIPEPSTWALMILGFGIVGAAWRRRRVLMRIVRTLPMLCCQRVLLLADVPAG
ncbi:hypothetical protein SCH01S_48_00230 [Sphingomonas changbaiensis NBRC 104936]|uniref:Ice-binding protein C-terminal domain-containing protein n=1 Tax=Sphingomonas changbaiensis NBRC 104936 TaxID=1219043 RepID=A0A0E9MTC6_9SPHN|nr:PEPxxWA-CTERM sorting domain-containing protein [Sphingomonas changbaiensis]GAO40365.1 hypothetical protein SCH01S_48_00230 [Sphingomonas changbaiensis NBRC 104936]